MAWYAEGSTLVRIVQMHSNPEQMSIAIYEAGYSSWGVTRMWPFLAEGQVRISTDDRWALDENDPHILYRGMSTLSKADVTSQIKKALWKKVKPSFFQLSFEERYITLLEAIGSLDIDAE